MVHQGDIRAGNKKEPDKPNINYFAYFSYYPPPWNQLVSWDASFQFNEV